MVFKAHACRDAPSPHEPGIQGERGQGSEKSESSRAGSLGVSEWLALHAGVGGGTAGRWAGPGPGRAGPGPGPWPGPFLLSCLLAFGRRKSLLRRTNYDTRVVEVSL